MVSANWISNKITIFTSVITSFTTLIIPIHTVTDSWTTVITLLNTIIICFTTVNVSLTTAIILLLLVYQLW